MQQLLDSLGNVSAVIGAQWGDEGKGKVVDLLSEHFDVIARACGGANAGHTIVVNGKKHVFHLLPSGCLHEDKQIILGAGVVIHLPTLLEEIDTLKDAGIDILPRLSIAHNAHVLLDMHKEIDGALESRRQEQEGKGIGTTKRGIGPAYMDKAARRNLRMEYVHWSDKQLQTHLKRQLETAANTYGVKVEYDQELEQLTEAKKHLEAHVIFDTPSVLDLHRKNGHSILIEGAQATLLDIDHGTYPYVTSSSTTVAGALQGLGMPPRALDSCVGVAKAYCTRVGEGDFRTEAQGEAADRLRERGGEYGATTGRPRRCGWLDLADLRYAALLNGFTHWNLTKLDVLDEEENIPVNQSHSPDGAPQYEQMPGWKTSTAGLQTFDELPQAAQTYIAHIEKHTGVPVSLIGTGPGREDMIIRA